MNIEYKSPSYTQICGRAKSLEADIEAPKTKEKIYLVVDSTGLNVYGEGEWKARKHGVSKRRTWRKLHLGVNEKTGIIQSAISTKNGKGDSGAQQVKQLLEQTEAKIDKFSGDGAYDTYEVWSLVQELDIEGIIPPQLNANYWEDSDGNPTLHSRIFEKQKTENLIKIKCWNEMTRAGVPISFVVEN